jgi:hypothetical protein
MNQQICQLDIAFPETTSTGDHSARVTVGGRLVFACARGSCRSTTLELQGIRVLLNTTSLSSAGARASRSYWQKAPPSPQPPASPPPPPRRRPGLPPGASAPAPPSSRTAGASPFHGCIFVLGYNSVTSFQPFQPKMIDLHSRSLVVRRKGYEFGGSQRFIQIFCNGLRIGVPKLAHKRWAFR